MGKDTRKGAGPHEAAPGSLGELIHAAVRRAIQVAVDEELIAALGVRPYERGGGRCGYRNGTKSRTLTGPTGPLALTVPRASLFTPTGAREWASTLLPRYQRRLREVNEAVVATYLAGSNTRRLRGALRPLLKAAPLSKSAVSRVVGTLKAELEAWRTRSLADLDVLGLYLDALALRVRSAGKVVSVPVLGVVAVLTDGQKQFVALELLTFFQFPKRQWKTLRTTNVIERLNEEFRRRVKTQGALPTEDAALVLLFGLVVSGQIRLRRLDGWRQIPAVLGQRPRTAA